MERWEGKVAVVTGASSGIGAAIAVALVKNGMKVIALARRVEKIEELREVADGPGELFAFQADVSKEEDIAAAFDFVKNEFGSIHVLVNNAGICRPGYVTSMNTTYLREVIEVNLMAAALCYQQAIKLMQETGVEDGHFIFINSTMGHEVPFGRESLNNLYAASKHGITAMVKSVRHELFTLGLINVKVTSISPGYVLTEVVDAAMKRLIDDGEDVQIPETITDARALTPQQLADSVIYILSTPPIVLVEELTIRPVGEMF